MIGRKNIRTNFAFKLYIFAIIIIKIILRSATAWIFNINSNIFAITAFNWLDIIIFDKLLLAKGSIIAGASILNKRYLTSSGLSSR